MSRVTKAHSAAHPFRPAHPTPDDVARRLSFIKSRFAPAPGEPWVAAVSRSHGDVRTEAFVDSWPGAIREKLGSAVKFGWIAEGKADIYPRLAPTSEWDVGAGYALVTAAGGKVTDEAGGPLRFGEQSEGFIVPAFIACGDPSVVVRMRTSDSGH